MITTGTASSRHKHIPLKGRCQTRLGSMDRQLLLQCKDVTLQTNLISANGEIPHQLQVLSFVTAALFWNGRDSRTHQILWFISFKTSWLGRCKGLSNTGEKYTLKTRSVSKTGKCSAYTHTCIRTLVLCCYHGDHHSNYSWVVILRKINCRKLGWDTSGYTLSREI